MIGDVLDRRIHCGEQRKPDFKRLAKRLVRVLDSPWPQARGTIVEIIGALLAAEAERGD